MILYIASKNNKLFKNKIEAINISADATRLFYHDNIFQKFDWLKEPDESLDELYTEQARILREKYDYLILAYSGGADSHQILTTFHQNNIKLDEIHTFCPHDMLGVAEENKEYNQVGILLEYERAFWPRYRDLIHQFKWKAFDTTTFIKENFKNEKFWEAKKDILTSIQLFYVLNWSAYFQKLRNHLEKMTIPKEKIGLIFGIDRPNIEINTKTELFVKFSEIPLNQLTEFEEICVPIPFYWDPDYPKIICKQAHLLKKELEIKFELIGVCSSMKHWRYIRNSDWFKKLLYPNSFDASIWQQWHKSKNDDDMFRLYFEQADDVIGDITRNIVIPYNTPYRLNNGKSTCLSQKYLVGQIKTPAESGGNAGAES